MIRTRFAPSPTGSLHIAGIRNALYCYALAKKHNGKFIVRIEDTDQTRFVPGSIEEIFEVLDLYGLTPDESIIHGGEYGPYIQSQRLNIYNKYIQKLIDKGYAYYCFLEEGELKSLQKSYKGKGFRSPYRNISKIEVESKLSKNIPYVIRLKVPEGEKIEFVDGIQGKIIFDTDVVGDEILIKSNGMPSYHFAVVVDDYEMKISHVIRSIEWLPSTPKQIILYKYLNLPMPKYYHPPVILDPLGGKLSKRKGTVSARKFLEEGYLVEAILNFVMLLGWAPKIERMHGHKEKELFTIEEFIQLFDLSDINKSNPVFNRDKLIWFNMQYIKSLSLQDLEIKFINWLKKFSNLNFKEKIIEDIDLKKKLSLLNTRSKTLVELAESLRFFYKRPEITKEIFLIDQLSSFRDKLTIIASEIIKVIENLDENSENWDKDKWSSEMKEISQKNSLQNGDSFMLLRVMITGSPYSPPLFESMQILGKKELIDRFSIFFKVSD